MINDIKCFGKVNEQNSNNILVIYLIIFWWYICHTWI